VTYSSLGDYAQALELNLECLSLYEKLLGKEHLEYATSLDHLAQTYSSLGDYAKALELNLECLSLYEKLLGKEHLYYAMSLGNLAYTYRFLGDYGIALELNLECLSLSENIYGKEHPYYATSLANLAVTYISLGDYAQALELNLECLSLCEKIYGKEHPYYATSLSNLALPYGYLGDYAEQFELNLECLSLYEKIYGKEHPGYALSLNNLAATYSHLGEFTQALTLNLECLSLREKLLGKEHPGYALSLNNLAMTYSALGDYAQALELNLECLSLYEKLLGKEHPSYALSLNNLAHTYGYLGDSTKSLELNLECLSLNEKLLGKEHPDYARSLNNLALTYSSIADFNSAYDAIMQWLEWSSGRLIANESNLNTGLREEHYAAHLEGLQMAMQIAQLADKPFPYAYWLSARSRDLGTAQILSRAVASSEDAELIAVLDEMRRINSQLSQLEEQVYEKPQLRAFMDELQTQSALLERRLMQESAVYAALQKQISVADLAGVLNAGEVFVDIMPLEPSQVDSTYSYVAFVLSSGDTVPEIVELGPGGFLDSKYSVYSSYTQDLRDPEVFGGACFDIYWEPLLSSLGDADRVYYCPDGVYAKMNPGVFYDPNKSSYVLDELDIRLVSSGTDLVRQREGFYELLSAGEDASLSALLLGDPKFDLEEGWRSGNESLAFERDIRAVLNDTLTRGTSISRLPGTRTEVEGLSATLKSGGYQVETLMDKRASEARLKQADLVDVLHLATHGYFLENVKREFDEFGMQQGGRSQAVQENPMHRSGLLLAGAENTRRGEDISGTENGWFSAQEASGLNLLGTDLVVMSACETGKGDIQNGRGVFGLQRAMRAAGAESVVMSLWSVDDDATSALMQSFYGHWLNGMSTPDALKMAQDDLRQKRPHPYYWGAWVCTGE
jgi:tetratricopeptide (TPR) repeat protein